MNIDEIWMDIPNYEGYYKASNLGRIKSFIRNKNGRIMRPTRNREGYYKLRLWKDGAFISTSVHRSVLSAFVKNEFNKPRVNHIDNNPSNNILSNLEWATHQEDIDHKCKQNRQNRPVGVKNPRFGKTGFSSPNYGKHYNVGASSHFARLVLDTQTGIFYDCVKDAAFAKEYNSGTLYNRLIGNRKNKTGLILVPDN